MGRKKACKEQRKAAKIKALSESQNTHLPTIPLQLQQMIPGRAPPSYSISAQQTADMMTCPEIQRQTAAAKAMIEAIGELVDGTKWKVGETGIIEVDLKELKKPEPEPEPEPVTQGTQTEPMKPTWRQLFYMPYLGKK